MKNLFTILILLALLHYDGFAQRKIDARDQAVEITTEMTSVGKTGLMLKWKDNDSHVGAIQIKRKNASDKNFPTTALVQLAAGTSSWADTTIENGQRYTYEVAIVGNAIYDGSAQDYMAFGYIEAGLDAHEIYDYGKVLLLVDVTMYDLLKTEIARLIEDLEAEGWAVVMRTAPRAETFDRAKVDTVKAIINAVYAEDNNLRSVFLLGRLPIAYAGLSNTDGHDNHKGAWPSDMYYADINNEKWTDATVNDISASLERNHNVPNDGKFDIDALKTNTGLLIAELAVGRVDLFDMPVFHHSAWDNPEAELLRQYLNKDHAWRTGLWADIPKTGIVCDNFKGMLECFASSGWRNFSSVLGIESVNEIAKDTFIPTLKDNAHLFAYGTGGGSYTTCGGIGITADFANNEVKAPFMFLFGSYFGDWDMQNNILRAPLCSMPYGLTICWDGRPHWYFHELVMGQSFGKSVLTSQNNAYINNNSYATIYYPNLTKYQGQNIIYEAGSTGRQMCFLGDPTLRLDSYQGQTVSDVSVTQEEKAAILKWVGPETDNIYHFNIYRRHGLEESWIRLNNEPVSSETFIDETNYKAGLAYYQVRVAELVSCNTGSYFRVGRAASSSIDFAFTPEPAITTSKESLEYGEVMPNASKTLAFMIENTGHAPLTISKMSITGENNDVFEILSGTIDEAIEIGKKVNVRVQYHPVNENTDEAILEIHSDATNANIQKVTLTGICTATGVDDAIPAFTVNVLPNPVSTRCNIALSAIRPTNTELIIFDMAGNIIRKYSVVANQNSLIEWNLQDEAGNQVPTGTYILKVSNNLVQQTMKIQVIK